MEIDIFDSKKALGIQAASRAAQKINESIDQNDVAYIILATGASQFETLNSLVNTQNIDWSKVVMFHLDEYVGIQDSHSASFRRYLKERFIDKVPALKSVHLIEGDGDLQIVCRRLNHAISGQLIDVALVGMGENGHLAFNDPPADFDTEQPYLVVDLDEKCRQQQMGEGWFKTVDDVPKKAISMSVKQIMKSKTIICSVPDERKSLAVKNCLEGKVSNLHPASILQNHSDCTIYLDSGSASQLKSRNN